jgi:predicted nucleotidyltransferase
MRFFVAIVIFVSVVLEPWPFFRPLIARRPGFRTKLSPGSSRAPMEQGSIQQRFAAALDGLVETVKEDRSILAAVLCGSLSHDTVWARSDIDLVLVTVDDKKVEASDLALYADGVNVHAILIPRTQFRQTVEGSVHNSFIHSLLAKGRLLYTHDPSIADLSARLRDIGDRDTELQLLRAATGALSSIDKAHKWFVTRGDLDYTALWILYAATSLARVEVIGAGLLADREVIPQAMALNPAFFRTIYTDLLNSKKTRTTVEAALGAIDSYVAERAAKIFGLLIEHLREAGEARSATEIETYFKRNFDLGGVTTACEYLADRGVIGKVSTPVRLTRRSNVEVQELAFVFLTPPETLQGAP